MDVLIVRLDAPLMSFGAPAVDNRGVVQAHPPLSLVTGLIGNALGYTHSDPKRLQILQGRIRLAARRDVPGERITDFQTVDLGQRALSEPGWTTRGAAEGRKGGSARERTHIRYREYLADAVYTVALTLDPEDSAVNLDMVEAALNVPERPLFIGRKCCLPSGRLVVRRMETPSLLEALRFCPLDPRAGDGPEARCVEAWWPATEEEEEGPEVPVTDERDWTNQVHSGERLVRHGIVQVKEDANGP